MQLNDSIDTIPKTSIATKNKLRKGGINTIYEFLNILPLKYKDLSQSILIKDVYKIFEKKTLFSNENFSNEDLENSYIFCKGIIRFAKNEYLKKDLTIQKFILEDETGSIELIWFRQPYIISQIPIGSYVYVSGKPAIYKGRRVIYADEYEVKGEISIHTNRIVPVYTSRFSISTRTIREKLWDIINLLQIKDFLPKEIKKRYNLMDLAKAYKNIHFPESNTDIKNAKHRLAFNELFIMQLSAELIRKQWRKEHSAIELKKEPFMENIQKFEKSLPFVLTSSQKKCINELISDLTKKTPMNRLLQGDVGSGKTIVAAFGILLCGLNGYQSVLMAPTEILAEQHYDTLCSLFKKTFNIALFTSSKKHDVKDADVIIGTHALISKNISFERVAFVIVDEQHKFGVAQRAELKKKGINPHLLTMTATPIPRTLCLTLYKELDVSFLKELPKNRKSVKTFIVPPNKREKAYQWLKKTILEKNYQAFIICPLIEESENESMTNVKTVKGEYEKISKKIFPDLKVSLLHGKMKPSEKTTIIKNFQKGNINILVSTSVVEVGVDIPSANIIIIESADRFGLAQLHQLRGRVGRRDKQGYCLLFSSTEEEKAISRLIKFTKIHNGFELAEYDLKHRGGGELYGLRQHGLSDLSIASLADKPLILQTSMAVSEFIKNYNLEDYPELKSIINSKKITCISRD